MKDFGKFGDYPLRLSCGHKVMRTLIGLMLDSNIYWVRYGGGVEDSIILNCVVVGI